MLGSRLLDSRRAQLVALASCGGFLVGINRAWAQGSGAAPPPTDPPVPQELTSSPTPGRATASLTASATLTGGTSETRGLVIVGVADYTTRGRWLMRLDLASNFASTAAKAGDPHVKLTDNHMVSGLFMHPLRPKLSVVLMAGWRRDEIVRLDRRIWGEAGIGIHIVEHKLVHLVVAPTYAVGRERRSFTESGANVADFGIYQTFSLSVPGKFSIQEYLHSGIDSTATVDRSTEFKLSWLSPIAPHVGLQIAYKFQEDTLPPKGTPPRQYTISFGVTVGLSKGKAPTP